jgi:hypothetical protein
MQPWWKSGGYSGIVFVVLFVIGFILQFDAPMVDDSGAEIKQYFIDDGTIYLLGDILIGIGFVFFFLVFAWALSAFIAASETAGENWSRLILVYAAIATAVGFAFSMFNAALAYGAAEFTDENTVKALYYAGDVGLMTGPPLLVGGLTLTIGICILRFGAFPKWLGWLSIVIAVLSTISVFGLLMDDPENALSLLGALAFLLWAVQTLALSYFMISADELPVPADAVPTLA